jgi:hypothetical protein
MWLPKMPYKWSIPVINNIQMQQVSRGPKGPDGVFGRHKDLNRNGAIQSGVPGRDVLRPSRQFRTDNEFRKGQVSCQR